MEVSAKKANENKFQPVELTLRFDSEAELAVFMTSLGRTVPADDWSYFKRSNLLKEMFPRVVELDFLAAKSAYSPAYKALSNKGYLK